MAKGGKEYRRLIAAFERIFGATMFFGSDLQSAKARVVHRARFNFLREATIWYERGSNDRLADEPFENVIALSDEFYEEILAHPIPTDLDIIKVPAPSPAMLDLFVWLSYRCFTAKGTESIPLFGKYGLARQLGCVEYSRPRKCRSMIDKWLKTVRVLSPQLRARIDNAGLRLIIEKMSCSTKSFECALNRTEIASLSR